MPKRAGFLIPLIADIDNLRLAFWKARRSKDDRNDVQLYRRNLSDNLLSLQRQLLGGEVEVGNYHYFTIHDPKERQICSAVFGERVLHHALMNVCHDSFERYQSYHSYASRKGKGQYAALTQAQHNSCRYKWYLKLDVRKYFDSISHPVLNQQLARLFKDKYLLNIFRQIISTYQASPDTGLPIGNLTSQYFANHYLAIADHYAQETLQVMGYVRYMDDIVMWHSDKEALLQKGKLFETYINEHLRLCLKPPCLNQNTYGLPFLGYMLYPNNKVHLLHRSKHRYLRKLRHYTQLLEQGTWSEVNFVRHAQPLTAFVRHANTYHFRKKHILS